MAVTTVPGAHHEYYGQSSYWNDFDVVRARLNERATGDAGTTWFQLLAREGRRFERALVLNCGNGWVERDLFRSGLVDQAVGIDVDDRSLAEARRTAAEAGFDATYLRVDINVDALPAGPFDLVVNYAACHHISAIDRVLRQVAERMATDGIFVHWDYVGPHRNQFTARQWERMWNVNRELPDDLRQRLVYPHLDTMLHNDPTEAVHSELFLPVLERYFDLDLHRRLGGGVAYVLLTHNPAFARQPAEVTAPWLEYLMDADQRFLDEAPDESLFSFIISRQRRERPAADVLAQWTREEDERERAAIANGGRYYPPTMLAELSRALERGHGATPPASTLRHTIARRFPRVAGAYRRSRQVVKRAIPLGR